MSREKQGFRDTIAQLNEMFPDKGALSRKDVAKFMGVNRTTTYNWKIQFNPVTKLVTKADFARQICI